MKRDWWVKIDKCFFFFQDFFLFYYSTQTLRKLLSLLIRWRHEFSLGQCQVMWTLLECYRGGRGRRKTLHWNYILCDPVFIIFNFFFSPFLYLLDSTWGKKVPRGLLKKKEWKSMNYNYISLDGGLLTKTTGILSLFAYLWLRRLTHIRVWWDTIKLSDDTGGKTWEENYTVVYSITFVHSVSRWWGNRDESTTK